MTAYLRQYLFEAAGLQISKLRMSFNIVYDTQPFNPGSIINLFNLGRETAAKLSERGTEVRLSVAYRGLDELGPPLNLVILGEVRTVQHEQQGTDRVTTLTLGGADAKLKDSQTVRNYDGLVKLPGLVQTIVAADMRLAVGDISTLPDETLFEWAWSGKSSDALTSLLEPRDLRWFEFKREVRFSTPAVPVIEHTVQIDSAHGLVGSPSVTDKGARARVLLDPTIEVGMLARLRSEQIDGLYKIVQLLHRGDSWQGDNQTELELHLLRPTTG